jgi:serine/threonine-protein kinase
MTALVLEGRYQLGRELGSGGFSRVFEATDLKMKRAVAVKLVPEALAAQPEVAQRLEREGRIAAALSHPNVCAVTDAGRAPGGAPFIVLERLAGETLAARLARGPLARDEAIDVASQLLGGLGAAHAAGVVHRDLKPANVFLVPLDGGGALVKLLDFGLAQVRGGPAFDAAALTRGGLVVGTAAYMSPEQVRGERDLDARTDVYSAAVVLYEMFAGARPFAALPSSEMLDAIAHKKPPPLASRAREGAPPGVLGAVDAALAVSREHRPADASRLLAMLRGGATDDWDLPTWQGEPPEPGDGLR